MTRIYIKNGNVVLNDRIVKGAAVTISGGRISAVSKKVKAKKGSFILDAKGCYVSPGFIDTHIHGSPSDVFLNEISGGTTSIILAFFCDSLDKIAAKTEEVKRFKRTSFLGKNLLGIRLEGPCINKARCGAQNELFIHRPDKTQFLQILDMCQGLLKIMTIAPELKGARALIKILKRKNILASIGHSDATYEEAIGGIDAGITHSTHLFNGMRGIDRRDPGAAGAVLLDERVTAEVILDTVHVHHAMFDLLIKVKGLDKVILVTDSIKASPPEGARKSGLVYRFKGGTLTGSSISMIDVLRNAVTRCGLTILDAVRLISLNPARLLGAGRRKGSIEPGKDADIVIFNREFDVKATLVRGKIAYRKSL